MATATDMQEAAFEQQAISWWYDWRRFLDLQIRLMSLHALGGGQADTAFEAAESPDIQERTIREQLDAIPHERRKVFDDELKSRRSKVYRVMEDELRAAGLRKLPDPDEVERLTLKELYEAAEGAHTDGWGEVPTTRGMYDLDVSVLADVPDEGNYRVGTPKNKLVIGISAIVLLTFMFIGAVVWISLPPDEGAVVTSDEPILIGNAPVSPWEPLELTVRGSAGTVTYAVGSADGEATKIASWPLTICVPGEALPEGAASATVRSSGATPSRRYTLGEGVAGAADLILQSCEGEGELVGRIAHIEPIQPVALDAATTIDGHAVTVRALLMRGQAEDAAIPAGQAQVQVHVVSTGAVDWTPLTPQFRYATANDVMQGNAPVVADGVAVFSYLVPLPSSPIEVAWDLTDPATGQIFRWRAALIPPPSRDEYLRSALSNVTLEAAAETRGRIQITMAITNGATGALRLTTQDISITSGGQPASVNSLPELIEPLAEGETRTVTFSLATGDQQVRVRLGSFAFEVSPSGSEGR